jgi:hypothetical protein
MFAKEKHRERPGTQASSWLGRHFACRGQSAATDARCGNPQLSATCATAPRPRLLSEGLQPATGKKRISNRQIRRLESYLNPAKSSPAPSLIAKNDDLTKVVVLSDQRESKELSRDCDPFFSASFSVVNYYISNRNIPRLESYLTPAKSSSMPFLIATKRNNPNSSSGFTESSNHAKRRSDIGLISRGYGPRIDGSTMKCCRYNAIVLQPSEACWADVFMDVISPNRSRND